MPDAPPAPADPADPSLRAGADEVRVLGGRARLRQRTDGYRAGLDAALLAAAVASGLAEGAHAIEAGCGVGGALVQAALRAPGARFTGLERDPEALALARENAALNALAGRVELQAGDVDAGFARAGLARADAAFANPPFFDDPAALRAPSAARRGAWMADGGLAAWTGFLLAAVHDGGAVTMVHRADRLGDLLALLGETAGDLRVRPVHPFADAPAKRVLVRCRRLSRAPLTLLGPLVLHGPDGAPAPRAAAVLRGEAPLAWER